MIRRHLRSSRDLAPYYGRMLRFESALADGGFVTLLLLRLTPLPFGVSNIFLGSILGIRASTHAAATALGFLRLAANVYLGSQLRVLLLEEGGDAGALRRGIGIAGAAAFLLASANVARLLLKKRTDAPTRRVIRRPPGRVPGR